MIISVFVTFPDESTAQSVSKNLLNRRLIACSNIYPIHSLYNWKGELCKEGEYVAIMKSRPGLWEKIIHEVEHIHPYDIPCIVKYEVESNPAYERWIKTETLPV